MELYFPSMIFWIGDLNYRLSDIDIESVKSLITKKEYDKLFRHDQVSFFNYMYCVKMAVYLCIVLPAVDISDA